MIQLSYTSLSALHNGHEWLNKQMKIPVPDYPFLTEGKEGHQIIQDHISGNKEHKDLKSVKVRFPIVEEKDFDERCKFKFNITRLGKEYLIIGFYDGRDGNYERIVEIKLSGTPWSLTKFKGSIQRKIYAFSNDKIKEQFLITGFRQPERWKLNPPKVKSLMVKPQDITDALGWMIEGIDILEEGDFTGGLDENGKCEGCFYNMSQYPELANCNFL